MPTVLSKRATEKSTYKITVTFKDDEGDSVAPDTLTWTLTDESGSVINSRSDVTISSPESSETIVLRGNDLALQSGESGEVARYFTIEATYDSDAGLDLPLNDHALFYVTEVKSIS